MESKKINPLVAGAAGAVAGALGAAALSMRDKDFREVATKKLNKAKTVIAKKSEEVKDKIEKMDK